MQLPLLNHTIHGIPGLRHLGVFGTVRAVRAVWAVWAVWTVGHWCYFIVRHGRPVGTRPPACACHGTGRTASTRT